VPLVPPPNMMRRDKALWWQDRHTKIRAQRSEKLPGLIAEGYRVGVVGPALDWWAGTFTVVEVLDRPAPAMRETVVHD
jgi:hypothetical protein